MQRARARAQNCVFSALCSSTCLVVAGAAICFVISLSRSGGKNWRLLAY